MYKISQLALIALAMSLFQINELHSQATAATTTLTGVLPASPTQFLGSTNAADIIFKSTNVERMRLLSTGNFGIGTLTPNQRLHLNVSGTNDGLRITQSGTSAASLYLQNTAAGGNNFALFSSGTANFQGAGKLLFHDFNGNVTRMTIVGGTGNIGINNNNPTQRLHINDGAIFITGVSPSGGPMLLLGGGGAPDPNGQWGIEYVATGNTGLNFWRPWPAPNSGNNFLFLNDNGNIGIGTDVPAYKLDVCGTIRSKEVRVEIGWCDYVFEKDYKLRTLSEVENYINENKHLPEVPAASVIETEGLALAEMQAIHMKKIEELTLYMIALEKKCNDLQARLIEIENK